MYQPLSDSSAMPRTSYTAGAGDPLGTPALVGTTKADVVVIGGGFVGCSAALNLAEGGRSVILLENNEIGWGAAGRNAGHVAPHASKLEPESVLKVYGPHYGPRLNEVGANAPQLVTDLADRLGIDISVVRGGILTGGHSMAAMDRLAARARYWQARGAAVELLDRKATIDVIGGDFYAGSIIDRRGIAINPLAFVRGIARAAVARGAEIHEQSKVVALTPQNDKWRVNTSAGEVSCDRVLLCTNAYTDDLWSGLRRTIVPVRGYQIWSKPISQNIRPQILRGISAMLDTRRLPTGVRLHPDGRLQFSGGPGIGREQAPDFEAKLDRVRTLLPQLGTVEIDGWWSGWIAKGVADGWRMHRLANGLYAAIGCNGRGVAMGVVMGRELARCAMGVPEADLIMPLTEMHRQFGYAFHEPAARAMLSLYGWQDRREVKKTRENLESGAVPAVL